MSSAAAPTDPTAEFEIVTHYYHFDQQGVVFNMWYLSFVEDARNAYFAHRGHSLADLLAAGLDIQVVHVTVDWSGPVHYGQRVTVAVSTAHVGTTSLTLEFRVLADGHESARCRSTYVIVDAAIAGKARIPAHMRAALLNGVEAHV